MNFDESDIPYNKHPSQCLYEFENYIRKQDHFNANVMKQLKYNSDIIACLSDLLFRISNDVRGVGKHASMVQTQLEQVAKSQRELLDEMNNDIHDFVVRVATRGCKMTQEPLYPEGHPKRIEQDSQRNNTTAPSPSKKKKKKKNDRTLHASSEPEVEKPPDNDNDVSISDAETQSSNEHSPSDNEKDNADVHEDTQPDNDKQPDNNVEIKPAVDLDNPQSKNKIYDKKDFVGRKHGREREPCPKTHALST